MSIGAEKLTLIGSQLLKFPVQRQIDRQTRMQTVVKTLPSPLSKWRVPYGNKNSMCLRPIKRLPSRVWCFQTVLSILSCNFVFFLPSSRAVYMCTIVTQAYFVVNCCTGPFVYIAFILLCSLYSLSVVCIYRFRVGLTSLTMMRV